jgi:hypothetical protein
MSRNTKTKLAGWTTTKDLSTIIGNCEKFNQGRTYEIFGEYCNLTPNILKERGAHCWLYYENEKLCGFALGRRKRGILLRMGDNFIFKRSGVHAMAHQMSWVNQAKETLKEFLSSRNYSIPQNGSHP